MDEQAMYLKNCEDLITARTEQLRQALTTYEDLLKLVGDALPALRQVEDPAVRTLVARYLEKSASLDSIVGL